MCERASLINRLVPMNQYLLTPPIAEPVLLADAKLSARVDGSQWDGIITPAIQAARELAEQETRQRFMAQTWRIELDAFPAPAACTPRPTTFPYYRPSSLAIAYWDGSAWQVLATNAYAWAPVGSGFSIAPALTMAWPLLGDIAIGPRVRIDVTLGAAAAAAVPECVKTFVRAVVTMMLRDPTLTVTDMPAAYPFLLRILDPARLY